MEPEEKRHCNVDPRTAEFARHSKEKKETKKKNKKQKNLPQPVTSAVQTEGKHL